jgi:hypothetical protein
MSTERLDVIDGLEFKWKPVGQHRNQRPAIKFCENRWQVWYNSTLETYYRLHIPSFICSMHAMVQQVIKSAPRNLVDLILARLNLTMVWSFIISMKLNVWGLDSSRAFGQSTAHITITALIHCKLDYCTIVCAKSTHISSKSINRLQLTKSYFCNVFWNSSC